MDFYFTVCQKLEAPEEIPEFWKAFLGEYTFESAIVNNIIGKGEIKLIDTNILYLEVSGDTIQLRQIITPINENEIMIIGGDYDGETMYFDTDQKHLRFGGFILKRK